MALVSHAPGVGLESPRGAPPIFRGAGPESGTRIQTGGFPLSGQERSQILQPCFCPLTSFLLRVSTPTFFPSHPLLPAPASGSLQISVPAHPYHPQSSSGAQGGQDGRGVGLSCSLPALAESWQASSRPPPTPRASGQKVIILSALHRAPAFPAKRQK